MPVSRKICKHLRQKACYIHREAEDSKAPLQRICLPRQRAMLLGVRDAKFQIIMH